MCAKMPPHASSLNWLRHFETAGCAEKVKKSKKKIRLKTGPGSDHLRSPYMQASASAVRFAAIADYEIPSVSSICSMMLTNIFDNVVREVPCLAYYDEKKH